MNGSCPATGRRSLTAATAGSLALLGALVGTLLPVPLLHLLFIVVCLPVIATVAGWLFAGYEPATLARQPIE